MIRVHILILMILSLSASPVFAASVPDRASAVGRELDRQLVARLGQVESPAQGVSLFATTPVDSADLEETNALARQMQEEISRWFVQAGYQVQEIRKGTDVIFSSEAEMLLTRKPELLCTTNATATAVMAGTYTITGQNVRFNIRLITTTGNTVLAMSTVTIPITHEVKTLLGRKDHGIGGAIEPSVVNRLP